MDDADAATSGAAAADGGGAARRGGAPPKAKRVVKPLTRAKLEDFQAAQENRGVCYFSYLKRGRRRPASPAREIVELGEKASSHSSIGAASPKRTQKTLMSAHPVWAFTSHVQPLTYRINPPWASSRRRRR